MKQIFLAIQQQLLTVPALKHIDKNWNQLNYEQPPVRWPCALIDIANADYSQVAHLHQIAEADVEIIIADLRFTNTSQRNPNREDGFDIFTLLDDVHQALQGFRPANAQQLVRTNLQKVENGFNYEVYKMTYRTSWNVEKLTDTTSAHVDPVIVNEFINRRFTEVQ